MRVSSLIGSFKIRENLLVIRGGICLFYHIVTFTERERERRSNFVYAILFTTFIGAESSSFLLSIELWLILGCKIMIRRQKCMIFYFLMAVFLEV